MPDPSLLKKLHLAAGQRILLLNASPEWEQFLAQTQTVKTKPAPDTELVLLFAPDKTTLAKLIGQVKPVISENGIVWVAYPKGSSKMQTDLTRDKGWESMPETEWQPLNLISLDKTWSAFSFRLAGGKEVKGRRALRKEVDLAIQPQNPYIDSVNRIINLPEDLGLVLSENKNALVFFETLSFTNRKEYVTWVLDAKRPETRQSRVLETVTKLDKKLKNPRDKGE